MRVTYLTARTCFFALVTLSAFFIVAHVLLQKMESNHELTGVQMDVVDRFNMDSETSVPTWFAQTLLSLSAALLGYIALTKWQTGASFRHHWLMLSGIFMYLSIDEAAALHEIAISPMQRVFHITGGYLFFAWIIPAGVLFLALTLGYFHFWLTLSLQIRMLFGVAAIIFLAGAVGVEMLAGRYYAARGVDFQYRLMNAAEDGLELVGVSTFIYALLLYISMIPEEQLPKIRVRAK